MHLTVWLLIVASALLVLLQLGRVLGWRRGVGLGFLALGAWAGLWGVLHWQSRVVPVARPDQGTATSETCFKCHEAQYTSWHRSYHRTMTRDATPEYVKGDFNNASLTFQGVTSHFTRSGDAFFMTTAAPD